MAQRKTSFTVPAGAGAYAPEILYLNQMNSTDELFDELRELTVAVEALPATATLELDLLKTGGDADADGGYLLAAQTWNTVALQALLQLAAYRGARIRCKSGGTAGTAIAHVAWW